MTLTMTRRELLSAGALLAVFPSMSLPAKRPPRSTMKFGTAIPTSITALESNLGVTLAAHRTYSKIIPASFDQHPAHADQGRRFAVASVKWADWTDFNGAADAFYAFGLTWPGDTDGAIILNHEPEDDGQSASDFRRMQRHCGTAWHSLNNGIPFGGCLMRWTLDPRSGRNVADWLVSNQYWDFLAWDGYDRSSNPDAGAVFDAAVQVNNDNGLQFAVAEYGSIHQRGQFTGDVADYAAAQGAPFCTYFDSTIGGTDWVWRPVDYPAVAAVDLKYGGSVLAVAA